MPVCQVFLYDILVSFDSGPISGVELKRACLRFEENRKTTKQEKDLLFLRQETTWNHEETAAHDFSIVPLTEIGLVHLKNFYRK